MAPDKFEFSVPRHTLHLSGYMDAVGRVLTTDSQLYGLNARIIDSGEAIEAVIGAQVTDSTSIDKWSAEFGSLVEDFLGMDQNSRLGFYLIDMICWFKEFTDNAVCHRLDCRPLHTEVVARAVHLLELENEQRVLLIATKTKK